MTEFLKLSHEQVEHRQIMVHSSQRCLKSLSKERPFFNWNSDEGPFGVPSLLSPAACGTWLAGFVVPTPQEGDGERPGWAKHEE